MSYRKDIIAVCVTAVLIIGAALASFCGKTESYSLSGHIVCAIQTGCYSESDGLPAGYGYYLLERYAEKTGRTLDILLSDSPGLVDSLRTGAIDILVLPMSDSVGHTSGITVSKPVDSLFCWALDKKYANDAEDINNWLDEWLGNKENEQTRKRFLSIINPYRKRSGAAFLSPYDDIIKKYAGRIEWDWRLLAAVIYQESHFRIDVISRRGAMGLMQIMPSTAEHLGVTDLADPEKSIGAGSEYLGRLFRYFKDNDDEAERYLFTLASYNAGASKINACMEYAGLHGVDPTIWSNIVGIIPDMREDGLFLGAETIAYVEKVLDVYGEFCRICP